MKNLKLKKLNADFSVCKVKDYSQIDLSKDFCFTAKTDEENSLVCQTKDVPKNTTECSDTWKAFRIDEGMLDFSLIGILSKIANLLAQEKIGIFAVSTFNTDYIFTKSENFEKALKVLKSAGYEIED